jgi:ATP-binding cassette subfamily C (CFTR/MRP) protein 1
MSIAAHERVGVVGRTGSGKSTLVSVLFRLVEAAHGHVSIDGVSTAAMSLSTLRGALGIIPQEATLFEGSLRSNLDPLGEHSDADIWEAVQRCVPPTQPSHPT